MASATRSALPTPFTSTLADSISTQRPSASNCYPPDLVKSPRFFRFVDDIELRLEEDEGVVQVRSASRVGRSDFGVNRKRVERLRAGFRSP
ncbi:MAG: hypothetical protein DSZ00_05330 [Gammaproteobacteria bacterium]|nr:MAG: hypothetical protein DSZ02_08035 [Gammaproteobacteria bacterium]RTZ73964.1 MAG: hypothetical protein DSZ00_05330 [Gammaproteobacteria bacterium]